MAINAVLSFSVRGGNGSSEGLWATLAWGTDRLADNIERLFRPGVPLGLIVNCGVVIEGVGAVTGVTVGAGSTVDTKLSSRSGKGPAYNM